MATTLDSTFAIEKKFNFIKALEIITTVENSDKKGSYKDLKQALNGELGPNAFKKMATLGFIHGGFYILNGEIIETYAVSKSYKDWNRIVQNNKKACASKFPFINFILMK